MQVVNFAFGWSYVGSDVAVVHSETSGYKPLRRATVVEPLLTVNELAQLLGVARSTVYRIVNRGELNFVRAGKRLRFRPADVDAYLNRPLA